MTLHDYRSRQVHKTLNGVNPSRDMHAAKSGPNLSQIWQVLAHGQPHMGQIVKWPWRCTTRGLENHRKSVKQLQRYGFRKSGSRPAGHPPARLGARTVTTIQCSYCGHSSQDPQSFAWLFCIQKFPLTFHIILWLFPGLEKYFSLTAGNPVCISEILE